MPHWVGIVVVVAFGVGHTYPPPQRPSPQLAGGGVAGPTVALPSVLSLQRAGSPQPALDAFGRASIW